MHYEDFGIELSLLIVSFYYFCSHWINVYSVFIYV
jgi:hypothetical protein